MSASSSSSTASCPEPTAAGTFLYARRYIPRCELAKLALEQMQALHLRGIDIVRAMGYPPKHTFAATDRLRYVLCSPVLGLDGSYIDPFYDANDFLETLFDILKLPSEQYRAEMETIRQTWAQ